MCGDSPTKSKIAYSNRIVSGVESLWPQFCQLSGSASRRAGLMRTTLDMERTEMEPREKTRGTALDTVDTFENSEPNLSS